MAMPYRDRARVRATITVLPADPHVKMPDVTTGYPETVLLRLINSTGRPNVKIEATELGSSVGLGGEIILLRRQLLASEQVAFHLLATAPIQSVPPV